MPYCPACRADYAPGIERCHDCEIDLEEPVDEPPSESPALPPEPLVTIGSFDTPLKANILASRLEADGVECFVADAETIGTYCLLAGAVGGVKIQVRESDGPRAAAILRANTSRTDAPPCPQCGSRDVRRKGLSILAGALAVLTLGVLALFFPVVWTCLGCRHRWK
jgi:putative signal transducing protein